MTYQPPCDQKHNVGRGMDGYEFYKFRPNQLNAHEHRLSVSERLEGTNLALTDRVYKDLGRGTVSSWFILGVLHDDFILLKLICK